MSRAMRLSSLMSRTLAGCLLVVAMTACGKSEPTYTGISVIAHNYLPYNLDGFTITDAYGNKAGGGVIACQVAEVA